MLVVTGAAGFIGSHLAAYLRARGHRVVGIDRRPGADLQGDLACPDDDVRAALRDATAVFHLAGCGGVRHPDGEVAWWRDNVRATEEVLAAVPLATPLVVTSSSSVYGGTRHGRASAERDPLRPRGGYARSKVAVERRCAARLGRGGHVAIARPFTVAGEGQRADMAIARWLDAGRRGLPVRVFGSLERRRDVTDVRDVARALAALAESGATGPCNIGTGRSHRLADLLAAVSDAVGPLDVVVEPASHDEVAATRADTTRAERILGFRLHTDLVDLVRRQAAAALPAPA